MAVHPLAQKLEVAIEHALRALEALRKAKEAGADQPENQWWDWIDALGRKRVNTRIFGHGQLGALAAAGMERQAEVQAGEANNSFGRVAGEMRVDKTMRALQIKLAQEEGKCARARALLIRDSGREVSYPCPGATAARQALADYMLRTYGDTQYGVANSGGGGGGGW